MATSSLLGMSVATAAAALALTPRAALGDNPNAFSPFKFQSAAPGMESWFKDAKLGMFMHWGCVIMIWASRVCARACCVCGSTG